MSQAETFGERLRAEAGLAQEQLAELAGKVPASIGRWEADGRGIKLDDMHALAEALGRPLRDLTDGIRPRTKSKRK